MCYNGVVQRWVYNGLGVHEVATTYGAIFYETILLLFLV